MCNTCQQRIFHCLIEPYLRWRNTSNSMRPKMATAEAPQPAKISTMSPALYASVPSAIHSSWRVYQGEGTVRVSLEGGGKMRLKDTWVALVDVQAGLAHGLATHSVDYFHKNKNIEAVLELTCS
jgi:hypothetical protein